MAAYAYPITIDDNPREVRFNEIVHVQSMSLTIALLERIVGQDNFSIHELDWMEGGGYDISVTRTRMETPDEVAARVARERAYMAEYNRRHNKD